ncbi:MAG: hypothetical protein J6I73_00165 [Treponema sp.]|nr:hypothetical protein [Treponema sp.]
MFVLLLFPFLIAVTHHCYAAYHGNDAGRNTARIVMLAFELVIALSIVPSGFSFAETVSYWLEWWNIPFLAPFALLLAAGFLRARSVLLGVSSPKSECATALYFGLSQFLVIFCFSVMAAASV